MKQKAFTPIVLLSVVCMIFLLGTGSCDSGDDIQLPPSPSLYGNWNWVESVGGFAGHRITPETQGYTVRYTFLLYGDFEEYRDNKPFVKSRYSVIRQVLGRDTVDVLTFDHRPSMRNILRFSGDDTLKLTEYCVDCYQHTFIREK